MFIYHPHVRRPTINAKIAKNAKSFLVKVLLCGAFFRHGNIRLICAVFK